MSKSLLCQNKFIDSVCTYNGGLLHIIDLNMKLMIKASDFVPALFKSEPWIKSWFLDTNQFLMKVPYHLNYKDLGALLEPGCTDPWVNRLQFLSIYNDYDADVHSKCSAHTQIQRIINTFELVETYIGGLSKIFRGCAQIRNILVNEHPSHSILSDIIPTLDTITDFLLEIAKSLNISID